ncbi:MAG: TIGR01777 family oxidoreductase [Planctomycetes bacterium]|nr:TIGR01777 family oxidoreductase [Planctomycetota bacterium]
MKVAVTGATGFVGRHLCAMLQEKKHQVVALTRDVSKAPRGAEAKVWDGKDAVFLKAAVAGCDAIVNLAGENIFGRKWTSEFKAALRSSRVDVTKACVEACKDGPKVLVSASAIGYYGARGPLPIDEEGQGDQWNFLSSICLEWEAEAKKAEAHGARVALLRIGVVLGRDGGALEKMLPPFRAGFGGPIGKGDQFFSWIHIDDLCSMFIRAVEDPSWKGPFNATAPNSLSNKDFSKALGRVLHRPAFFPTPPFVLKLMLGEVADLLTTGQNVVPKKAAAAGFEFRYPEAEEALRNLLGVPEAKTA